jgi:lipopolysaccharide export system protein LptC
MMRRILLIVIPALLASAATLFLLRQHDANLDTTADSPLAQDYDYFLSSMQLDRFAPDGRLNYHLESARVTHYPSPDHSRLENPSLLWYEPGQPDWKLTALSGDLRTDPANGQHQLLLQQEVVASRMPIEGATLDIRSDSLLLLPDSGMVSTTDQVQLHRGNTRLDGTGMQAWLRESRIKLSAGSGQHE